MIESRQSYCNENGVQFFWPTRYSVLPVRIRYVIRHHSVQWCCVDADKVYNYVRRRRHTIRWVCESNSVRSRASSVTGTDARHLRSGISSIAAQYYTNRWWKRTFVLEILFSSTNVILGAVSCLVRSRFVNVRSQYGVTSTRMIIKVWY